MISHYKMPRQNLCYHCDCLQDPQDCCRANSLDYSLMKRPSQNSFLWQNPNSSTFQHPFFPCPHVTTWATDHKTPHIYLKNDRFFWLLQFFLISQSERNLAFPDGPMYFTSWNTKGTSSINSIVTNISLWQRGKWRGKNQNFVPTSIFPLEQRGITCSKHFFFCHFLLLWPKVFHAT